MGSVCADQHKFQYSSHHQLFLNRKAIDIPPRKLLGRRSAAAGGTDMFADSPTSAEEALLQKFLPYNGCSDDDDDDADPYSSDHFRMYEFKVRRCTRSRSHDWTDCPFAHPGEKARRRDPRRYHYSGTVCSEYRRGSCSRGDNCGFAHGVFECWLHPARYRTEACKDGKNCKRKICFFAHWPRQLRLSPPPSSSSQCHDNSSPPLNSPEDRKYRKLNNCCVFCNSVTASPTSTLMGMSHLSPPLSPSFSPPLSPAAQMSRYRDRLATIDSSAGLSYKGALIELMSSLESMNVNEASSHVHGVTNNRNLSWDNVNSKNCFVDEEQFVLSPSTSSSIQFPSVSRNSSFRSQLVEDKLIGDNGLANCPDLGWVNDLLT